MGSKRLHNNSNSQMYDSIETLQEPKQNVQDLITVNSVNGENPQIHSCTFSIQPSFWQHQTFLKIKSGTESTFFFYLMPNFEVALLVQSKSESFLMNNG